ncbi:MAG: hypothetical protein MJK10_01360 [Pseudomonadales bacterium]|nr:hypothetical protein [Pseudomonadales bacterium]NRA14524.1 hypothetical protein [Oceanospirillaceae bacterium]
MSDILIDRKKCSVIAEIEGLISEALLGFESLVSQHQTNSWDTIRFELWNDTGRVLIFPSLGSTPYRIDQCGIEITCDEVLNTIFEATNSDMPESEYELLESGISAKIVEYIFSASAVVPSAQIAVFEYGDKQIFKS